MGLALHAPAPTLPAVQPGRQRHALPPLLRHWPLVGGTGPLSLAGIAALLRDNWHAYHADGQPLHVVVTSKKPPRNQQQNARLWALLTLMEPVPVGGKCFPKEAWHEALKGDFLGWADLPGGGRMPLSTAALTVAEFASYMTAVEAHLAERYGVYLPPDFA